MNGKYWTPYLGGQQAVRMGKWKNLSGNMKKDGLNTLLFDLESDIQEQNNVAAQYPDVVRKAEEIMAREHEKAYYSSFQIKVLD